MTAFYNFHNYLDLIADNQFVYHAGQPQSQTVRKHFIIQENTLSLRIFPHFHPYVTPLVRRLIQESIRGLQAADTEYRKADNTIVATPESGTTPVLFEELFSATKYAPSALVEKPYPVKDLDFNSDGAYSVYNWELFYHVPLTLAIHLSKNQRFEEAMRWFHFIFDPTDSSDGSTPERFWKVKPFQKKNVEQIEEILLNLAANVDSDLRERTISSIGAWKNAPFRPHAVARYRPSAYMFKAVMAYLDNLIDWGDMLFRQDTGESINEAAQLYVLAANILGPRPQAVPRKGSVRPQTYDSMRQDLDAFGNALRKLESEIPFNLAPQPPAAGDTERIATIRSLGNTLYFCIPRNEKLLSYWDTVADRLFKIRNSLNIQGIFRQLPLFEPPIDPAMLARAAAAGLDVSAIISGMNQPLPLVRFSLLLQKASELCQEVKSLGNNLLSALEKEDNEALAALRAHHETVILQLAESVKYRQWQEAIKNREALELTLQNAVQRYVYYERLLGNSSPTLPAMDGLDQAGLEKQKFSAVEPVIEPRAVSIDIAADTSGEGRGRIMSLPEVQELVALKSAREKQDDASLKDKIGAVLSFIPDFTPDVKFWGMGVGLAFGGSLLSRAMSFWASIARAEGDVLTYQAGSRSKMGAYSRREQDWAFQSASASGEINQTFKQIRAAQIRESVAEREWLNHQQQIENAQEIERFLTDEKQGKKTQKAFYTWMKREVKGLYAQSFQFAFDVAKKAERALQHELGDPSLSYLQFGYLGGKEGLLAGEKLYLDLKRMEMAYHDLNAREYELTKNVSLLQLNPDALLLLRTTGRCTVLLPETLFDMDGPGHYFRRIKSVAVSLPAVTGPYTSINLTLTLLKSSIRVSPLLSDQTYTREGSEDSRFSDYFGRVQSIVTSTGRNDSGLFETNLRDERYLPFEGSGVISEWQLELPAEVRQFDYDTISDVILNIRYTAREGGGALRDAAVSDLTSLLEEAHAPGSVRLFSLRHEFPQVWTRFKNAEVTQTNWAEIEVVFREEHYPYWSKGYLQAVKRVELYAQTEVSELEVGSKADGSGEKDKLTKQVEHQDMKLLRGALVKVKPPAKPADTAAPENSTLSFFLNSTDVDDLWIALAWGKS